MPLAPISKSTDMLDVAKLSPEVLVIGGGVAALRAAIAALEAGANVTVCCKGLVGRSGNTVPSTADISAYVPELGPDDSEATFCQDTLASGASIADERLVRLLAERSGAALLDLERFGIRLLRSGERIDRTRAAGHSRARTYRADSTGLGANKGLSLSVPLAQHARDLGARCLDRTPVVGLEARDGCIAGAVAVDLATETIFRFECPAVVLAAGGASHLFARTNGTVDATGDVIAFAMRAGAEARDLEFVQWHPTRLDSPVPMFVTNGLLADGAVFRDAAGREFMADYDPRGSLAPRDILAKAVYLEASSGRGVNGGVYLDCSAVLQERIALRHAHLAETLNKHGLDFPRDWLVVSPATHFSMGGITVDCDGSSSLAGCFAAGEAAGGLHGANRLGGNAFCEGLVFGAIAGAAASAWARTANAVPSTGDTLEQLRAAIDLRAEDPRPALTAMWRRLRETMWERASLVRDASGLAAAACLIETLADQAAALQAPGARGAARILDLRAGLDCARAIVAAANFREESRGAHWRSDFPDTLDNWLGHVAMRWPSGARDPQLHFHPRV